MNFYRDLGFLILGSRLKRLSEAFLSEINSVYQAQGIEFEASWFPVFYLLWHNGSLSIKELSAFTEVSHPAASQLVTNLKNRKLLKTTTCKEDGRRQLVELTQAGKDLLEKILPVWEAIKITMEEIADGDDEGGHFLPVITALENSFRSVDLAEKIGHKISALNNTIIHEQHI
jgi:DNA-binding MarR family transcriptional regulator